jgi:hypothetical protein
MLSSYIRGVFKGLSLEEYFRIFSRDKQFLLEG